MRQQNKYLSWEFSHSQHNTTLPQPALSILPLNVCILNPTFLQGECTDTSMLNNLQDPVADWVGAARILHSADFFGNLKTVVRRSRSSIYHHCLFRIRVESQTVDGAHWVHLENPVPVNMALRQWLDEIEPQITRAQARPVDEL